MEKKNTQQKMIQDAVDQLGKAHFVVVKRTRWDEILNKIHELREEIERLRGPVLHKRRHAGMD